MSAEMKFITVVARSEMILEVNQLRLLPVFSVGNQDGRHMTLSLLFPWILGIKCGVHTLAALFEFIKPKLLLNFRD